MVLLKAKIMRYRLLKDELMRALALVGQGSDFEGKCEKRTIEGGRND